MYLCHASWPTETDTDPKFGTHTLIDLIWKKVFFLFFRKTDFEGRQPWKTTLSVSRLDFLHISSIASFSYLFTFVLKKVEYFFENFRVNEIFRPSNEIEIRKQYYLSIVHSNLSWIWHNRAFISVPNWHWSFWKLYRVNRGHSSIMSSSSGGGR